MKTLLKIATFIAVAVITTPAVAETAETIGAPFGLQWGQSQANLEAAGVVFSGCHAEGGFTRCYATNLPKPISFADGYGLWFHSTARLQYVGAFGDWNVERHAEIKLRLIKKYGEPVVDEDKIASWEDGFGTIIVLGSSPDSLTIIYATGEYQNLMESHENRKADEANRNDDNL